MELPHPRSTPTRTSVQAAEPSEDDRPLQELKGAGQHRTLPSVLSTNNMAADRVGDVVEEYVHLFCAAPDRSTPVGIH